MRPRPLVGSLVAGLVASLCCGGSLVFASLGLGLAYGALGLWRFVPQALALGALSIALINFFGYARAARRVGAPGGSTVGLRRGMFISASVGIAGMAASFVLLEWLNHAVVNPHAFLPLPDYGAALVPGVPNVRLLFAAASFAPLALLWVAPFPESARPGALVRAGVYAASGVVVAALAVATLAAIGPTQAAPSEHTPVHHGAP